MKCRLTEEVIERFYKSELTSELNKHIDNCFECKTTIYIIAQFNSLSFRQMPSNSVDEYILNYAIERCSELNLYRYLKKISLSFLFAASVFMFVFLPKSYDFTNDTIERKISYLEDETKYFIYSYYEDTSFDFLNN